MTVELRENGIAGKVMMDEFGASVSFSEWYNGDGYDLEISRGFSEPQKFSLTTEEIAAIAKMGLMVNAFSLIDIVSDVEKSKEYNRKREETLSEIRENYRRMPVELEAAYDEAHRPLADIYGDPFSGGVGTPSEYHVEGWGIQKLDNGDFEVTYKV